MLYLTSRKNYYSNVLKTIAIFLIALIVVQFLRPITPVADAILLFVLFIYLASKKIITTITIDNQKVIIEYYQWFVKRKLTTSVKDVSLSFSTEISFRSIDKKPTLSIKSIGFNTSINRLDGFDNEEIISFYNSYKASITE
jgi:hypothetical protein